MKIKKNKELSQIKSNLIKDIENTKARLHMLLYFFYFFIVYYYSE